MANKAETTEAPKVATVSQAVKAMQSATKGMSKADVREAVRQFWAAAKRK